MQAAVAKIEIERASQRIRVIIHSGRPGVIIGRKGAEIDRLRDELRGIVNKELQIDIKEIKQPAISAQLVAENIAFQLEKRIAFRRAMKRAVQQAMTSGAQGIKMRCRGRLDGAEIARKESYKQGKVPLQTIKADVDYGFAEAHTTAGLIGIKVWIYKGDIIIGKKAAVEEKTEENIRSAEDKSQGTEKA
jgi:small subunit ribosomal protein S3